MSTPVDELRAAATLIRETASNATPGPWHTVGLPWNHDTPFVVAGHPDPHVGKFVADVEQVFADDEDDRDHGPDAAWIALMHPKVAEPLAAWLEEAATAVEFLGDLADKSLVNAASPLAVACSILGRSS